VLHTTVPAVRFGTGIRATWDMSRNNLFGTACRTCRRRGRKCDRSLPTCISCRTRGVECEGYILRWVAVDGNARKSLSGQTCMAPGEEIDLQLALESRIPRKANTQKAHRLEIAPHAHRQAKAASRADRPETHENITECSSSNPQSVKFPAIYIRRQQNLSIPISSGIGSDNLGGLIEYCMKIT
jgi:hypothetical protein